MSSFTRRMQRTHVPSRPHLEGPDVDRRVVTNPPRTKPYMGRGANLGVTNPKAKDLLARKRRDAAREQRRTEREPHP